MKKSKRDAICLTLLIFVAFMVMLTGALWESSTVDKIGVLGIVFLGVVAVSAISSMAWSLQGRGKPALLNNFSDGEVLTVLGFPNDVIVVRNQHGGEYFVKWEDNIVPKEGDIIKKDLDTREMTVFGRVIPADSVDKEST